jgi:hypothetical protein
MLIGQKIELEYFGNKDYSIIIEILTK